MNISHILKSPASNPSALGGVYILLCLLIPVVAIFNSHAIVPITAAGALAVLIITARNGELRTIFSIDKWLAVAVAAYVVAILVATLADGITGGAVRSIGKLLGVIVIAAVLIPLQAHLSEDDRAWTFRALLSSVVISLVWMLVDVLLNGELSVLFFGFDRTRNDLDVRLMYYGYFWYKPVSAVAAVMALVVGIYLQKTGKTALAVGVVLLSLLTSHLIDSRTAMAGLVAGMAAGVGYQLLGRHRLRVILVLLALVFLSPVWMAVGGFSANTISAHLHKEYSASTSIAYRLHIWNFTLERILEKPVLGWGIGASKRIGTDAAEPIRDPVYGVMGEPIPVHPHNAVLQIWLEFGLIGALAAFAFLARGLVIAERTVSSAGERIWLFSTIGLFACFFGVNFSISSSWWLTVVVVSAAFAATFTAAGKERREI